MQKGCKKSVSVRTDAADLHARAGQGAEGGLGTGPGGLGAATTRGAQLDVESRDAALLVRGAG